MKIRKFIKKFSAGILGILLALVMGAGFPAVPVQAAAGTVYTCTIHPCYRHPVTGEIEDSGGEASYATGQGMVDGAVYPTGILELTDSGEYYLTIRMSLMDYTANHSFWVQNVGDSGWSTPALGVTGSGTDNNGATSDICIQVPSENCVIRAAMYVEPMGRDVIFYLYPSDYTAGNSTDMNATIVTSASGSGTSASGAAAAGGTGSTGSGSSGSGTGTAGTGASLQGSSGLSTSGSSDSDSSTEETAGSDAPALSSSIEEAAAPAADSASDAELSDAQGLSLSTAGDASGAEEAGSSGGSGAFAVGAAVTVSGLILMGAAALIVYFFRKNWRRWGGGYDDEED